MLFSVCGGFAIWEAVRTVLHPSAHQRFGWAYGVLVAAFMFNGVSFAVAVRQMRRDQAGEQLHEYLRDVRDPIVVAVVLEDGAALPSILIAMTGLTLTYVTGSRCGMAAPRRSSAWC